MLSSLSSYFQGKHSCYDHNIAQTHLCRLRFREEDLSLMFPCRQTAVDNEFPACATCHAELSMWTLTKQTNSYSSSFSDRNLSIKHRRETRSYSPVLPQQPWCSIYKKKAALHQLAIDTHTFPQYRSVVQQRFVH